jgi:hypothetical protein
VGLRGELGQERPDVQRDDHPERDRDEDDRDRRDLGQEPDLLEELLERPGPAEDRVDRLEADGEHPSDLVHEAERTAGREAGSHG